ncbi:hypothetical protein HN670_01505 [bacterium]|jgi:hypothetical protein|nr:hypothetical protein [bacterium]
MENFSEENEGISATSAELTPLQAKVKKMFSNHEDWRVVGYQEPKPRPAKRFTGWS